MSAKENTRKNRVILVTGFGPFKGHEKNASWEAVKEIRDFEIERKLNVTLITEEIPVAYQRVSTIIPKLWEQYNPMLVLHVGVSSQAKCLTLESRAFKTGYVKLDIEEKCPLEMIENEEKRADNEIDILETEMDVKNICDNINNNCMSNDLDGDEEKQCKAIVSDNAGRFLCEYIFSQSLKIHKEKTMFVHVPDLAIYSAKKTAQGLLKVIEFAIEILEKSTK